MILDIYMKSGNVITIRHIESYEIKNNGDEIVSLMLEKEKRFGLTRHAGLVVKTIALTQIEAVVRR